MSPVVKPLRLLKTLLVYSFIRNSEYLYQGCLTLCKQSVFIILRLLLFYRSDRRLRKSLNTKCKTNCLRPLPLPTTTTIVDCYLLPDEPVPGNDNHFPVLCNSELFFTVCSLVLTYFLCKKITYSSLRQYCLYYLQK